YLSSACYCCTDAAITETSSLSLHDALPISVARRRRALEGGSAARSSGDSEGRGRCLRLPGIRPGSLDHRHRPGGRRRRFQPSDIDRKSTRLNSSHVKISYAVFCLKKKKTNK